VAIDKMPKRTSANLSGEDTGTPPRTSANLSGEDTGTPPVTV